MAEHQDRLDAKDGRAVFEAGDDVGCRRIAGDAGDEEVADALIEDQLDRHARIGAGQHRRERFLLRYGVVFQHDQIVVDPCHLIGGETPVACQQFLQSCVRGQIRLGNYFFGVC